MALDHEPRVARGDSRVAKARFAFVTERHRDASPAKLLEHGFCEATRCDREPDMMMRGLFGIPATGRNAIAI